MPTSRARRATPATSTCCARWSAAGRPGCPAPAARPRPATPTTCATAAPTRCASRRGSAAPPATSPPAQLDELVWADLCTLLTDPAQVTRALARARGGDWLPQELQARQATIRKALSQLDRQAQRLLDAYLAQVIGLDELQRKRQELDRRQATLAAQQRQLQATTEQRLELTAVADGIERFCQTIRTGLATATFTQRRQLAELLIDRVIVTDDQVEIRYVLPTTPDGPHPFASCEKTISVVQRMPAILARAGSGT